MGKRFLGVLVSACLLGGVCFLCLGSAQALDPADPEKAELVFSNGGRIVSIKADGSGRRELTRPKLGFGNPYQGDDSPEISPDGSRLVFVRSDELKDDFYRTHLMVSNRDGSGARPIVKAASGQDNESETTLYAPAWSADGAKIYYIDASIPGGDPDVWTTRVVEINADGSGRRVLAEKTLDLKELEAEVGDDDEVNWQALAKYWYFIDIDASPDGSQLLVGSAGLFGFSGLFGKMWKLDLAGGGMTVLVDKSFGGAWSSDGTKIAFMSQRQKLHEDCYELQCSYTTKIYVTDADGSSIERVTRGRARGNELYPSWSPDGTRIAFASDRNYPSGFVSYEVYSVRPDGSCLTWLTNGYPASSSPEWAPEAGDPDPGSCGAAGRKARVSHLPPAKSPTGQPNYWAGRNFRGLLSTYGSGPGEFLDYEDCGYFQAKRCEKLARFSITSENVCYGPLQRSLRFGNFNGLRRQRGALVSGGQPGRLQITTGRRTLGIRVDAGRARGKGASIQKAIFRALRRVGASKPVKRFPAARLSRRTVRNAARLANKVERGLPLGKRNLKKKKAYLRFHEAIERIGNVRTVPCPAPKKRPGPGFPSPVITPDRRELLSAPVSASQMFELINDREGSPVMRTALKTRFLSGGALVALLASLVVLNPGQSVALSPPPQKADVFFSNGGRIVSMQADGSGRRVLTRKGKVVRPPFQTPAGDRLPKVSPDGTRILFFRETERFPSDSPFSAEGKTMLANADGSGAKEIFRPGRNVTYREASWMPDGTIVAAKRVARGKKFGFRRESSVVILNPDGSGERTVFKLKPHLQGNLKRDLSTYFLPTELVASPDGQRLLVTIQNGYRNDDRTLEVVSVADGSRKVVAGKAYSGSWSPDGRRIAFASDKGTAGKVCIFEFDCVRTGDLFLADADGSGRTNLTRSNADETSPAWAPDGQTIVFSSNRQKPRDRVAAEIYSIRPDGQCLTWLTNGSPASITPAWGPDGSSDPGACGATERQPVVAGRPTGPLMLPFGGRLWVGQEYGGSLYSGDFEFIGISEIMYEDCSVFDRTGCAPPVAVTALSNCLLEGNWARMLKAGRSGGRPSIERGARVVQGKDDDGAYTMVFSGGSITAFGLEAVFGTGPAGSTLPEQRLMAGQLRPVGSRSLTGKLPKLRIPRSDIREAAKVTRVVKRSGSVRLAAKRLEMKPKRVRTHLSLKRSARWYGGMRAMSCPRGLASIFDLSSSGGSSSKGRRAEVSSLSNSAAAGPARQRAMDLLERIRV